MVLNTPPTPRGSPATMFMRSAPTATLSSVLDSLDSTPGTSVRATGDDVAVALVESDRPTVRVNELEVPLGLTGMEALSAWVDVPKTFLARQDPVLQEHIVNYLLSRKLETGIFRVDENAGLLDVRSPTSSVVEPRSVIEIMQGILTEHAPVVSFQATPDVFRLDTVVPEGFERGIGGDRPNVSRAAVGDLTHGGVRVIQNRKMNHAPQLSEFYYRLACTNGMEVEVEGDKIDARGQSVEDVLMEVELLAQRVMGRLDERILRFYDLRNESVRTPEQAILRIADERGISPRVATEIIRAVPTITDEGGSTSMFDIINLVTNFGNEPSVARREGSRILLERAGGATVHEHAERCGHCQSRLLS